MARSESTLRVNIPPTKTFKLWSDLSKLSDFLPSVMAAKRTGKGIYELTLNADEQKEKTTVAFTTIDKPRRLVWRSSQGAKWNGELILRPTAEGTELRLIVDFEPSSLRENPTERGTVVPTWNVGADLLSFKNYAEKVRVEEREVEPVGA